MPYYYFEEVNEELEEANVVSREDYDAVITERDEVYSQRDEAIARAEQAEEDLRKEKNKYANAFFTNGDRVKQWHNEDVRKDGQVQTFEELFSEKSDTGL